MPPIYRPDIKDKMDPSAADKQETPAAFEIDRLKRSLDELSYLNTLAGQIGGMHTTSEIIEVIVRQATRRLNAEQGAITLVERNTGQDSRTLVRSKLTKLEQPSYHIDQALIGWMIKNRAPLRIETVNGDARFPGIVWDAGVSSLLAVPLLVKGAMTGVLALYNKCGARGFSEEDQRLLAIIGAQSAQVLESARLAEEEAELRLLQQEMRMAAGIQRSLLPADTPSIAGYEIAGAYVPAQLIGGDYFDYIPLAGGRWGVVVADVSGKGIPAAMFMSVARTLMRVLARKDKGPGACLEALNDALCGEAADAMFITILYGVLDPAAHSFTYASAGHDVPLLISAGGGVGSLERPGGLLLGIFPDQKYRELAVAIAPGDALLMFTDGITEAADDRGTQFGEKALSDLLDKTREATAAGIVKSVCSAVDSFSCPEYKRDDLTAVAIRRRSAP